MISLLFGFLGAIGAVAAESLFAKYGASLGWARLFAVTFPLQALVSYSIFRVVQEGSVLLVPVVFGGFTALFRILSALALGQEVSPTLWTAYSLTLAALALKIGDSLGRH